MKVLSIVLNDFINDSRVIKTSRSLSLQGHEVLVVALHSDSLPEYESNDAFNVHRVNLKSRTWSKNRIVQLFKYAEFIVRVLWKYKNSFDVIHCNDLNTLPMGILLKAISNSSVSVVYDSHEYQTEIKGLSNKLKPLLRFIEKFLLRFVDKTITVSESISSEYKRIYGIEKPELVLNCPNYVVPYDQDLIREQLDITKEKKILLYQGGFSTGRGIDILLSAFESYEKGDIALVFMGYGPLEARIIEFAERVDDIYVLPAVSPDVLLQYTCSADFGVIFYEDNCLNHRFCSPNKIFEYLMAGIPVLSSKLFELERIINANGLGVVAKSNDVQGFLDALTDLSKYDNALFVQRLEENRQKFCWEAQERVLLKVYNDL